MNNKTSPGQTVPALCRGVLGLIGFLLIAFPAASAFAASASAPPAPVAPATEIDRRVYIPSSELGVLARDGKPGILLTQEEYQRLLREAAIEEHEPEETPFAARLESVNATATLEQADTSADECLRVRAVFSVRVLSATWGEIPFTFHDAAPISLKMDGKWFITAPESQAPHHLFVHGSGLHTIEVEFLTGVAKEAGERRVAFSLPRAPVGTLTVDLLGRNDVRSELPTHTTLTEKRTQVRLSLGGAPRLSFAWSPAVADEGEKSIPLFAQSHLAYGMKHGLIRITGTVLFSILIGDVPEQLSFLLPENGTVRSLSGRCFSTTEAEGIPGRGAAESDAETSALRGWNVSDGKVLIERAPGKADGLELDLEIEVPFEIGSTTPLPVIRVPEVFRHYGELAVVGDRSLQIQIGETVQLEPIEVSVFFGEEIHAPGQHISAYRFFAEPVSLSFAAGLVEPELEATVGSWAVFKKDAVYRQRYLEVVQAKGESRRLTIILPAREELIRFLDAQDREIDAAESPHENGTAYEIELPAVLQAGMGTSFTIESRIDPLGYRDLDETGMQVALLPIQVEQADRLSGTIAVGADPNLRLTDIEKGDLEPAPRPSEHPDALQAFFFRNAYQLRIRVSPKPSRLSAVVLLDLLSKENFLTVHGEVRYLVEGAGRKEFSLAFPKGLGATFFPEGDQIKERSLQQEDDRDVWEITTQDNVEGEFQVHFNGDVGMQASVTVPEVSVPEARRERGFIVVEANTETEIEFESTGLGTLDILDVPRMTVYRPKHRLIAAYEYVVHPYSLRLTVTRHEGEPVLQVIADRLDLLTIVSPGGFTRNRAAYQMRGVRTSFVNVELPERSILWTANVGGEPVKPMYGPDGSLRIPVSDSLQGERPVEVELVYESPAEEFSAAGNVEFLAPRLAQGVPVGRTEWHLFLPSEYIYRDFDSDLQLVDQPPPEPLLLSMADTAAEIGLSPWLMKARHDRVPQAMHKARLRQLAVSTETYYIDHNAYGESVAYEYDLNGLDADEPRELGYVDVSGKVALDAAYESTSPEQVPRALSGAVEEELENGGAPSISDLPDLRLAEDMEEEESRKRIEAEPHGGIPQGITAGRREAGILPFRIRLAPRGVEYVFHGLRQGERVAVNFRRVQNWNAWNVFIVIALGLIFAWRFREEDALKGTIWAVFLLTALPFVIGRDWTAFCNRLIIGILLGAILVLVIRIRKRWLLRAAKAVTVSVALLICITGIANADTVYIPYDPQHPEAATESTRIYVPYDRFERLWAAAKAHREGATEEPAPISYALEDAHYTVNLAEESTQITATYRLYLPQEKWVTIPFPFTGAEIFAARLDGEPARIEKKENHCLLYAREKGSHTLEFDMMAKGGIEKLRGSFALGIPSTFASQVRVVLPQKDLAADIQPYHGGRVVSVQDNRKEIVTGLGRTDTLQIRWYPEETRDRPSIPLSADILLRHSIVGLVENWSATLNLSFPGEKRSSFDFELDETLTLTAIKAANLEQWTIREQDNRRTLVVELSEDAEDSTVIELVAERRMDVPDRAVPTLIVPGARETITRVALFAAPWLDVRVDSGAFQRIARPVQEIPGLSAIGVYESHRPEETLTYHVEERPQEISWELHYLFQVERRKIEEILMVNMDVKRRPLFGLTVEIPEGYRCDRIDGDQVKDWWESTSPGEDGSRMDVEFTRGITGRSTMIITLIRLFPEEPNVLSIQPVSLIPPGDSVKTKTEGSVLIASHVSVQPRPVEEKGLTSTSLCEDELAVGDCKIGGGFVVSLPLERKLAYWFVTPGFSASFALERVEPRESIVWVTLAEAHETWIAYSTHVHWQLRQGSRRTWEFAAPAELGQILVTGKNVREVTWEDSENLRHYTVHLDTEIFDTESFVLSYESPIEQVATVPHLIFPNAERSSGYILTANASPYELSAHPSGSLKEAQRSDVPFLPQETGLLAYYKVFGGEWNLELRLIRTVAAETLPAVIDWVELETTIRRDGTTLNVASIRMQNKTLQFLPVLLPADARLLSLSVAGRATSANRTVRQGRETLLVPLIKTEPGDLAYEIRIIYEGKASDEPGLHQRFAFDDPEILDIPVTQTFWTFHFPDEYNIHYIRGNMEETTRTVREFEKLSAKEEERQRLKTIITGDYDLKKKARAISNYAKLQQEIVTEQGGLDLGTVGREVKLNRRLRDQSAEIQNEAQRISSEISRNIAADVSGTFQSQVNEVSKQIQARQEEIQEMETSLEILDESRRKGWLRNDDFDFDGEGIEKRQIRAQVLEDDAVETGGLTQVGSNIYVQRQQKPAAKEIGQKQIDRKSVAQYYNISQSMDQQQVMDRTITGSNEGIVDALGLESRKDVERYSQRVGGRFRGGPVSGQPPAQQPEDQAAVEPPPPPADQAVAPEEPFVAEGSYSIPIPFPREGKTVTFKKPMSNAEVRFTALDRRFAGKSLRIAILIVIALILHILMRWIGDLGLTHRLRERLES